MSSLANDNTNALHNVSVGGRSNNRDELDSDDKASPSRDSRQGSLASVQNEDSPKNRTPASGDPNVISLQSRFKALKVSCPPNLEYHGGQGERWHNFQSNILPYQHGFQYQGSVPQIDSQGTSDPYAAANQYYNGVRFPSTEVQPVLNSPGFIPPHYATEGPTYMHSTSLPGVIYPSQYSIGGYPYDASVIPSFLPGYVPHNEFDVQHINNFYGQLGFAPPFMDPHLQFHPPFGDLYNFPGHFDPLTMREGVIRNPVFEAQFRPGFAPVVPDHRSQNHGADVQIISQRSGSDYSGNSVNMGFYMPVPNTTLASPIFPGSPIGVNNFPGGRSDVSSPNSSRSAGFYGGWQGQRGKDTVNHQKPYSFLEELKSGKGRRFELSDIVGHVVEFSVDQHGSRLIQQKLEKGTVEDKASVFEEIVPHACELMNDVFGNYVIQKFFEYGTPDQRRNLAKALAGQILPLSLQMYGCRVIQKAFDVIELDQKIELVGELDGHVMQCVCDQNGNHVVQKCIECVPSERIGFIISAFRGQVASLSMHPYGCRAVQRVLEHCTDELESQFIVEEILEAVCTLAQDQYGNYVTQHVLERGKPQERSQIIKNISGNVVKMSQHKFASNVVEKCLEYGDTPSRELLISEVVEQIEGNDNLLVMMKDQYANYVVQKILEKCSESQREVLLGRIRVHLNALKKYTYGKHIVSRFEQLFGVLADTQVPTS